MDRQLMLTYKMHLMFYRLYDSWNDVATAVHLSCAHGHWFGLPLAYGRLDVLMLLQLACQAWSDEEHLG